MKSFQLLTSRTTLKKTFIYLFTIFTLISIYQQAYSDVPPEWVRRYFGSGNDFAAAVTADNLGNVYVTGYATIGAGANRNIKTFKYDTFGGIVWERTYDAGLNRNDEGRAIAVDNAGNVYVTGYSVTSMGGREYKTLKYDSAGVLQWDKGYVNSTDEDGFHSASSIAVDGGGNVWVTGSSSSPGNGLDYATVKYSSSGTELSEKRYPNPGADDAFQIKVDAIGNAYVTGRSTGSGTGYDYLTIKYPYTGGDLVWEKRYNSTANGNDEASSLVLDNDRNVYVTGRSTGSGTGFDYATIKINADGSQGWVMGAGPMGEIRYELPGIDEAKSIGIDDERNVYVTGRSAGTGTSDDYATIKYIQSGSTVSQGWVQRYNGLGNGSDSATSLTVDRFRNIYVAGRSFGAGTNTDYVTIKYNFSGDSLWVSRYNGPANNSDQPTSIANNNAGEVFVTGTSDGISSGRDYATLKFTPGKVTRPSAYDKIISGQSYTIKWEEADWGVVNIKCVLNYDIENKQEEIIIGEDLITPDNEYDWVVPEDFLSFRSKIVIENDLNPLQKFESQVFRIKPYLLTRIELDTNYDSVYYKFDKAHDGWGFEHDTSAFWPRHWYTKFNYRGIDSFNNQTLFIYKRQCFYKSK